MHNTISIRPMQEDDRASVLAMMRTFYDSPAVEHTAPDAILCQDFEDCIGACPFIEGFLLLYEGKTAGYAMVSFGYTTEYGGVCLWVEDLYLQSGYRHKGIGSALLAYLEERYPRAVRFKLEAEPENVTAIACYQKNGYAVSPYHLLTKERLGEYSEN